MGGNIQGCGLGFDVLETYQRLVSRQIVNVSVSGGRCLGHLRLVPITSVLRHRKCAALTIVSRDSVHVFSARGRVTAAASAEHRVRGAERNTEQAR